MRENAVTCFRPSVTPLGQVSDLSVLPVLTRCTLLLFPKRCSRVPNAAIPIRLSASSKLSYKPKKGRKSLLPI